MLEVITAMDDLLVDIKNFLLKLETGQMELQAGQWQLHKDLASVKAGFEELKKLKKKVDVMQAINDEQLGLMKKLRTKLGFIQSIECKNSWNFDKKIDRSNCGNKMEPNDKDEGSDYMEVNCDDMDAEQDDAVRSKAHSHPQCGKRKPGGEMLQRYLKDSAKYRRSSHSYTDYYKPQPCVARQEDDEDEESEEDEEDDDESAAKTVNYRYHGDSGIFWDEYGAQHPRRGSKADGCREDCVKDSVGPSTVPSLKKSTYKKKLRSSRRHRTPREHADYARIRRRSRGRRSNCRDSRVYRCRYCECICCSARELKSHSRICRALRKSRFRRK